MSKKTLTATPEIEAATEKLAELHVEKIRREQYHGALVDKQLKLRVAGCYEGPEYDKLEAEIGAAIAPCYEIDEEVRVATGELEAAYWDAGIWFWPRRRDVADGILQEAWRRYYERVASEGGATNG